MDIRGGCLSTKLARQGKGEKVKKIGLYGFGDVNDVKMPGGCSTGHRSKGNGSLCDDDKCTLVELESIIGDEITWHPT